MNVRKLSVATTLRSKDKLLYLDRPVVMGILNATPDSFYNKGRDSDIAGLIRNAEKMVADGAMMLDVGGVSTRPGQPMMNPAEEMDRVLPVISALKANLSGVWLSVDTYNAKTAKAAVEAGADMVNDISGGCFDAQMLSVVAKLNVPFIAMHIQGTPETMQQDPKYDDVVTEVLDTLIERDAQCRNAGIADVILDPGFGFGKTLEHNFALLRSLHLFRMTGRPILAGLSRKSMICKALKVDPENALNGTTALHMAALLQGASILRVHDVKEAVQTIQLAQWL